MQVERLARSEPEVLRVFAPAQALAALAAAVRQMFGEYALSLGGVVGADVKKLREAKEDEELRESLREMERYTDFELQQFDRRLRAGEGAQARAVRRQQLSQRPGGQGERLGPPPGLPPAVGRPPREDEQRAKDGAGSSSDSDDWRRRR